ncbi:MAG TPA: hypothetical protein VFJ90_15025 [Candidatus Didemnitutus sp.]|nr:hypothetical protein [Candidatus Didemnitutus sp.]
MKNLRDKILAVLIVGASLASVVVIKKYGGHRDPTDNGSWYLTLFGLAFVAGLVSPLQPWRWGMAVVAPQWLNAFYPEVSNLWPLAIVFMSILVLPCWLCAWVAAKIRLKFDELTGRLPPEPPVIETSAK